MEGGGGGKRLLVLYFLEREGAGDWSKGTDYPSQINFANFCGWFTMFG